MDDEVYKCPYCGKIFDTFNGLGKHRMHLHPEISKEQLLTDFKYNGIRPKCKCGCGEYTNIRNNGGAHFNDYVYGHADRVNNNWGHNKAALEKSLKTRKERFKKGEISIWNKGTTWKDTYTDEQIKKLKSLYNDKERCKKISEKLKQISNTPKERMRRSKLMKMRLDNGEFRISSELEDKFVENFINPIDKNYIRQYYIPEIHQYCDIVFVDKKRCIECDGSFWHCDKRLFPNGPLYEMQKRKVENDNIKNEWMKNNGFKILHIFEYDIIHSPEKVKDEIKKFLQ